MEKFAAEIFDTYRKILHPKNPKPDAFMKKLGSYLVAGTKFVTAVGGAFKEEHCFAHLKSKFLLRPQQKDKKNVQMCVQIGGNSFLAIQTGLVEMGGTDVPYSHCFAAAQGKLAINFFCTQNAVKRDTKGFTKVVEDIATKYLGFVQQRKPRELAALFNANVRGAFIKDEVYAGTMVDHVKAAVASNLVFGPWITKNARYLVAEGLGGTFSITTGLCCIGEENKARPVAFTHIFWMNGTSATAADKRKICVDVFRLNLG